MDDWFGWAVVAGIAAGVWLVWRLIGRPQAVIEVDRGAARVTSGQPPRGALDEIVAIAQLSPRARGRVSFHRNGTFTTEGLDEGDQQRLRNAMAFLRRRR